MGTPSSRVEMEAHGRRRARRLAPAIALLALATAVTAAGAADEPTAVDPDRPSVSTSARTVPPGAAQIETGAAYAYARVANAPADKQFAMEATVRVGVTPTLELRIDGQPIVRQWDGDDATGVGDLTLGAKWRLLEADGLRPAIGLFPFVKIPTATAPIGTTRVDGGLRVLASFELPSSWSLDANAGLAAISQPAGGPIVQGTVSAALSHPLTERLSAYAEMFFASHAERGEADALGVDGGLAWSLTRRVSLDAAVLTTVVGKGPSFALRLGLSARFGR